MYYYPSLPSWPRNINPALDSNLAHIFIFIYCPRAACLQKEAEGGQTKVAVASLPIRSKGTAQKVGRKEGGKEGICPSSVRFVANPMVIYRHQLLPIDSSSSRLLLSYPVNVRVESDFG